MNPVGYCEQRSHGTRKGESSSVLCDRSTRTGPASIVRGSSRRMTIMPAGNHARSANIISESAAPSTSFLVLRFPIESVRSALLSTARFVGIISSPSSRHDNVPKRCRNQSSSLKELMIFPRLPLRGRNRAFLWFSSMSTPQGVERLRR